MLTSLFKQFQITQLNRFMLCFCIILFFLGISLYRLAVAEVVVPTAEAAPLFAKPKRFEVAVPAIESSLKMDSSRWVEPQAEPPARGLNQPMPKSPPPEWQRPLPEEPSTPELNILSLTLPEVTSGILIVPALALEEPITRVLVVNGRWDISELDEQIGHLQTTGERPGDGLAMTFVGHTWAAGGPFSKLNQLNPGERIIYRWHGTDYIYEIEQMIHVAPTQVETLYEENGEAIVLATCSGWNAETYEYDTRLITRAILIDTIPSPNPRLDLLQ